MTEELITWLTVQLDEDERLAAAATPGPWRWGDWSATFGTLEEEPYVLERAPMFGPFPAIRHAEDQAVAVLRTEMADEESAANRAYIARHDATRALDEIAAKRMHIARWTHVNALLDDEPILNVVRAELLSVRRAYALVIADDALAYANQPGYRDEWRPEDPEELT